MSYRIQQLAGLGRALSRLRSAVSQYHRRRWRRCGCQLQRLPDAAASGVRACATQTEQLLSRNKIDDPFAFAMSRADLFYRQTLIVASHFASSVGVNAHSLPHPPTLPPPSPSSPASAGASVPHFPSSSSSSSTPPSAPPTPSASSSTQSASSSTSSASSSTPSASSLTPSASSSTPSASSSTPSASSSTPSASSSTPSASSSTPSASSSTPSASSSTPSASSSTPSASSSSASTSGTGLSSQPPPSASFSPPAAMTDSSVVLNDLHLSERSRQRRVPSSRVGRLANFGSLALGLGFGTAAEAAKRAVGQSEGESALLTPGNVDRIVATLCRVRGAALKLGQMISLQDESLVSPQVAEIFDRVRRSADFMPASQTSRVLAAELGKEWRDKFKEFNDRPFAAASIGQVHRAVLHNGEQVAVKVQYPGVSDSIDSDIANLTQLLRLWQVLPAGLYVESAIDVARRELAWECDYTREADCSRRFRRLLEDDETFFVPAVTDELSSRRVLTTQLARGISLDECASLRQETRDWLGHSLLRLCLRELFEFKFMQTDPNWANFLYDPELGRVVLLDFGASRQYKSDFVDDYLRVIVHAAAGDRDAVLHYSTQLGFLTGYENAEMNRAHCDAVLALGRPFAQSGLFDFGRQTTTRTIHSLVPTMLRHRLTPPPEESYSLHRKLSGAFLLCARLGSRIHCRQLLMQHFNHYKFTNTE